MSKIREILNKLNEDTEILTKERLREIINSITFENTELEENEELIEKTFNTMYNAYKCYGLTYDDKFVIPVGDYKNYLKDVANEFSQALSDGLKYFFDSNELSNYLITQNKDVANSYLESCINFINKNTGTDYYTYKQIDSGMYNGNEYILVEEN